MVLFVKELYNNHHYQYEFKKEDKTDFLNNICKNKEDRVIRLPSRHIFIMKLKIIKKGQTYPIYSASQAEPLEPIQLLIQSWEAQFHCMCHFLIILLTI